MSFQLLQQTQSFQPQQSSARYYQPQPAGPATFPQRPSFGPRRASDPAPVRVSSFSQDPHQQAQSFQQASFTLQRSIDKVRQQSLERLAREGQNSFERARQRSLERMRSIAHGREIGRQHSFTFRAENVNIDGTQNDKYDGSQIADCRNATQVAGLVSSLDGGSIFLKNRGSKNKSRSAMIPCHPSSSFTSKNYTVIKELGKGSFSRVQLLRDRSNGLARVLKIAEGGMGTKPSQMLKNEIQLLSALDHPNIIKIYECCEDAVRGQLLMVLEYVGGGDCQQLLRASAKPQSEAFIAKIIWQLLSVLCYCHARGILHCDIKPENMMLTQPSSGGYPDLKVIDFGLTHRIDQPTRDFVGTPSYMAPEIVTGTVVYTIKADIWSVGVTACELLASKAPFERPVDHKGDIEPVLQNIRDYRRFQDIEKRLNQSESWRCRSFSSKDFLKNLIIADPADRPHADQALEHDWLVKNKVAPTSLSLSMLKSMMRFMGASPLMRRCLLIIATRVGSPKLEQVGEVYCCIDDKQTGYISREDLAAALTSAATCWEPEFDVDDFFDAADQQRKEAISFLDFAATCLYSGEDTTNTIAERVFKALDDDRDGMVNFDECCDLFRDSDLTALRSLPRNRSFGLNEWLHAVGGSNEKPVIQEVEEKSIFARIVGPLFRNLLCAENDPGAEDSYELVCR